MLISVTTLLISFLLPLIYGLDSDPTILDSKVGVVCSRVTQHKGKGYIKVNGQKLPQDVKIPTFIFHYIDLLNFTNVPRVESYYNQYPNKLPEDLFSEDKFNIIPSKESEFDTAKYTMDTLTLPEMPSLLSLNQVSIVFILVKLRMPKFQFLLISKIHTVIWIIHHIWFILK